MGLAGKSNITDREMLGVGVGVKKKALSSILYLYEPAGSSGSIVL